MLASGRTQWSATYPSEEIIRKDIENETGYVLCSDDTIAAFGVVAFNGEPVYENIKGKWQSDYPLLLSTGWQSSHPCKGMGFPASFWKT